MNMCGQANIPAKSYPPEWLLTIAEANGFLLDSLNANRAGLYDEAQKLALVARGRREFQKNVRPASSAIVVLAEAQ